MLQNIKAVVLRVDSPGGDALASDLMWREIQILSKDKPVIASMSDTAASGAHCCARCLLRMLPAGRGALWQHPVCRCNPHQDRM